MAYCTGRPVWARSRAGTRLPRNLQLLVEYASDINGILILDAGREVPTSYRASFTLVFAMNFASVISPGHRQALLTSVEWRNNLVHEYEPESHEVFYARLQFVSPTASTRKPYIELSEEPTRSQRSKLLRVSPGRQLAPPFGFPASAPN